MALDFTQIDDKGVIERNVPIGTNAHEHLFYAIDPNKYPSLEKLREYYEADYVYSLNELPCLKKDLELLKEQHLDNKEYQALLESMIDLVEDSITKRFRIESISD